MVLVRWQKARIVRTLLASLFACVVFKGVSCGKQVPLLPQQDTGWVWLGGAVRCG